MSSGRSVTEPPNGSASPREHDGLVSVAGLLLAAGAGSRMGRPKALVEGWLPDTVDVLLAGGCAEVVVVLGSRAADARILVPERPDVRVVVVTDWAEGVSASLRAGLAALESTSHDAVVVMLVDLPDVTPDVVARVSAAAEPAAARRAVYDGRPGHPVLLGRDHWRPAAAGLSGDRGAGRYLVAVGAVAIECADLATGRDVDR